MSAALPVIAYAADAAAPLGYLALGLGGLALVTIVGTLLASLGSAPAPPEPSREDPVEPLPLG